MKDQENHTRNLSKYLAIETRNKAYLLSLRSGCFFWEEQVEIEQRFNWLPYWICERKKTRERKNEGEGGGGEEKRSIFFSLQILLVPPKTATTQAIIFAKHLDCKWVLKEDPKVIPPK